MSVMPAYNSPSRTGNSVLTIASRVMGTTALTMLSTTNKPPLSTGRHPMRYDAAKGPMARLMADSMADALSPMLSKSVWFRPAYKTSIAHTSTAGNHPWVPG